MVPVSKPSLKGGTVTNLKALCGRDTESGLSRTRPESKRLENSC
jgi:hypothetical protein